MSGAADGGGAGGRFDATERRERCHPAGVSTTPYCGMTFPSVVPSGSTAAAAAAAVVAAAGTADPADAAAASRMRRTTAVVECSGT